MFCFKSSQCIYFLTMDLMLLTTLPVTCTHLLGLAGTDTYFLGFTLVANNGARPVVVFIFFLVSYGIILNSLKNYSQEGRHKALST